MFIACHTGYLELSVRAVNEVKFSYLLKTDDDCFVDVVRVLQRLSEIPPDASRRVWLGRSVLFSDSFSVTMAPDEHLSECSSSYHSSECLTGCQFISKRRLHRNC